MGWLSTSYTSVLPGCIWPDTRGNTGLRDEISGRMPLPLPTSEIMTTNNIMGIAWWNKMLLLQPDAFPQSMRLTSVQTKMGRTAHSLIGNPGEGEIFSIWNQDRYTTYVFRE